VTHIKRDIQSHHAKNYCCDSCLRRPDLMAFILLSDLGVLDSGIRLFKLFWAKRCIFSGMLLRRLPQANSAACSLASFSACCCCCSSLSCSYAFFSCLILLTSSRSEGTCGVIFFSCKAQVQLHESINLTGTWQKRLAGTPVDFIIIINYPHWSRLQPSKLVWHKQC